MLDTTPSLTLGTLKQYAALTLSRVKKCGNEYRVERCPWCNSDRFTLKLYVFDGVGRCKCSRCRGGGDILALARAYLGMSSRLDRRAVEAHIWDRLRRGKHE